MSGDVYSFRRRQQLQSPLATESESTNQVATMLPYLGPEIIAVIQAVLDPASSDSRPCPGHPSHREDKDVDYFVVDLVIRSEASRLEGPRRLTVGCHPDLPVIKPCAAASVSKMTPFDANSSKSVL